MIWYEIIYTYQFNKVYEIYCKRDFKWENLPTDLTHLFPVMSKYLEEIGYTINEDGLQ